MALVNTLQILVGTRILVPTHGHHLLYPPFRRPRQIESIEFIDVIGELLES